MIKKIFMWIVYAAIVGLLIFGAANRTAAKMDQGVLFGRSEDITEDGQRRGGSGNSEISGDFGDVDHEENPVEHDWVSLNGQIILVDLRALEVLTEKYGILEISGRSWRFAQESGYLPDLGNEVILDGFFEIGEFEVSSIQDLSAGQIVFLRDEFGHPLWNGGSGE